MAPVAKSEDWISVLSDGETYTSIDGCYVMLPTKEGLEILDDGGDPLGFTGSQLLHKLKVTELLEFYLKHGGAHGAKG